MVIPILAAPFGLHRMDIRGNTHFNIVSQRQRMQNKRGISFVNPVQPLAVNIWMCLRLFWSPDLVPTNNSLLG